MIPVAVRSAGIFSSTASVIRLWLTHLKTLRLFLCVVLHMLSLLRSVFPVSFFFQPYDHDRPYDWLDRRPVD